MKYRSHHNGHLSEKDIGAQVQLVGWVQKKRNLGSLVFIDLRDRSGIVQLFFPNPDLAKDIKNEYLIQISGVVRKKDVANKALKTGAVEVEVSTLSTLNSSEVPPLIIDDVTDAGEETRLKYRYLDLRRQPMQDKLIIRSQITQVFHEYFAKYDYVHVETPLLTLSTPGGARDFLVPSRLHPGAFYALPQSPQIYKQLLMIGGMEKYYQIARCFRDEDLRADRQPDFTQIDVEASFLTQDEFLNQMETILAAVFKRVKNIDLTLPFARLSYQDAMEFYGSDKPDLRYEFKLSHPGMLLQNAFKQAGFLSQYLKGIRLPQALTTVTRKVIDEWTVFVKQFGIKGLVVIKNEGGQLVSSFSKYLQPDDYEAVLSQLQLEPNDLYVALTHDDAKTLATALGLLRLKAISLLNISPSNPFALAWVTDFPLFDTNEQGNLVSAHHPFTRPKDEDLAKLTSEPKAVIAQAYDLVINGYEAGGGSMRIYDKDTQRSIFSLLGLSDDEIQTKFGWFIDAFNYGTPPHGGIAFGLDRLTMILSNTDNIKDVIAFPKNLKMMGLLERTPNKVDDAQLNDLSLIIKEHV
jgi:aspartyl-tRNA synthetase